MSYTRVIPRDLFNEANLLKCLGCLELAVIDKGLQLTSKHDGEAFDIVQDDSDGSIRCTNMRFFLGEEEVIVYRPLNARGAFPVLGRIRGEEYYLFREDGSLMPSVLTEVRK